MSNGSGFGNGFNKSSYDTWLYISNSSKTVSNTVAETSLFSSSNTVGSLILPTLSVNKTFYIRMLGIHSATGNPTIRIKIKFNSTIILDTTTVTSGNSTNAFFDVKAMITCRSVGSSGTVIGQGFYTEAGGGSNNFPMVNTGVVTVDTTIQQTLDITAQWGTASTGNSLTQTNCVIDSYN